jgi:hypothetical protein
MGAMVAGETRVLGENLPRYHLAHHKPHMMIRHRTQAPAFGGQRRTARNMARALYGTTFRFNSPAILSYLWHSRECRGHLPFPSCTRRALVRGPFRLHVSISSFPGSSRVTISYWLKFQRLFRNSLDRPSQQTVFPFLVAYFATLTASRLRSVDW